MSTHSHTTHRVTIHTYIYIYIYMHTSGEARRGELGFCKSQQQQARGRRARATKQGRGGFGHCKMDTLRFWKCGMYVTACDCGGCVVFDALDKMEFISFLSFCHQLFVLLFCQSFYTKPKSLEFGPIQALRRFTHVRPKNHTRKILEIRCSAVAQRTKAPAQQSGPLPGRPVYEGGPAPRRSGTPTRGVGRQLYRMGHAQAQEIFLPAGLKKPARSEGAGYLASTRSKQASSKELPS
jgi:hypothetical protein